MLLSFKSLTNARGGTRESALSRFSSCFAAACSLLLTRIAPRFRALTILPHIRISCSLRYTFISLWGVHSRIRAVALLILLRRIFARLYRGKNKCLLRSRLFFPAYCIILRIFVQLEYFFNKQIKFFTMFRRILHCRILLLHRS